MLNKDIEEYGVLKITKKGETFLKKPKSFTIVLNNCLKKPMGMKMKKRRNQEKTVAADDKLFEMLKELRQKEAKKRNLPPFVIFLENSLQDMAIMYPTTLQELEKCQGVSKGKAFTLWKAICK